MKATPARAGTALLLTGFALLSMACGAVGKVREAADRSVRSNDLKQIALGYILYCEKHKKGPATIDDLFNDQPQVLQVVVQKVKNGDYIIRWDVNLTDQKLQLTGTVLGYDSAVPVSGGPVVMCNASVQIMTPAEFDAAPKAKSSDGKGK